MRLVQHKTDYIVIKAETNSVWDSCDFALVEITPEFIEMLEKARELSEPLKKELGYNFYNIALWVNPDGWYVDGNGLLPLDYWWSFVELEEGEPESFEEPEQAIDAVCMKVVNAAYFYFTGRGKHTSEYFSTFHIEIKELLEKWRS